jgi:hypothetical protein
MENFMLILLFELVLKQMNSTQNVMIFTVLLIKRKMTKLNLADKMLKKVSVLDDDEMVCN